MGVRIQDRLMDARSTGSRAVAADANPNRAVAPEIKSNLRAVTSGNSLKTLAALMRGRY